MKPLKQRGQDQDNGKKIKIKNPDFKNLESINQKSKAKEKGK